MLNILIFQVFHTVDPLADVRAFLHRHGRIGEDLLLHPVLQSVGELVAQAVEDLDAVVLKGVVACGDDHPRVRPHLHREIGHRRGGDGAQRHHVASHGGNARDQRPLQHVRGDAGVHADGHKRGLPLLLRQHRRHRLTHTISQFRRQIFADNAANAVCSE